MFNARQLVIDAFADYLQRAYWETFGKSDPTANGTLSFVAHMALESISRSDAPYHDWEHTTLVTQVGLEILRGKRLHEGTMDATTWCNFLVALLCHDIGYVRGVCRGDQPGSYVINEIGDVVTPPRSSTDAYLTPHHVDRGKLFVKQRLQNIDNLDVEFICATIERTRFPIPSDESYAATHDFPGLARAADLIGQLADTNYISKVSALFREFEETGESRRLNHRGAADLRESYPSFYWKSVSPYIQDALFYLRITQQGRQWVANLNSHVFAEEHQLLTFSGPERGTDSEFTPRLVR